MSRSQNGWPASPSPAALSVRPLLVEGANFPGGVAHHDSAAALLMYVARHFHYQVEKLRPGWCWGFYFRANRNNPNDLSNHSSGTAIDCNAPLHPNGVARSRNFSTKQIAKIHEILHEINSTKYGAVVRWGGDYTRTIDSMHFELVGSEAAVRAVVALIDAGEIGTRISVKDKVVTVLKRRPTARRAVKGADGKNVINVKAIFRGNTGAPNDITAVQHMLNLTFYPHRDDPQRLKEDGIYGAASYNALDAARVHFGLEHPVSHEHARRKTLRKLGFKTTN